MNGQMNESMYNRTNEQRKEGRKEGKKEGRKEEEPINIATYYTKYTFDRSSRISYSSIADD